MSLLSYVEVIGGTPESLTLFFTLSGQSEDATTRLSLVACRFTAITIACVPLLSAFHYPLAPAFDERLHDSHKLRYGRCIAHDERRSSRINDQQ